jgi:hypothetical protein
MRKPYRALRVSLLAVATLALLLWNVHVTPAARKPQTQKQTPVTMNIFFQIVDEQNTNAFYNTNGACSGSSSAIDTPYFTGDVANGPTSAYNFVPPWTFSSNLSSSQYVNGTDCATGSNICLGVNFNHNNTVLSLDTRNTLGPRTVDLNFSAPCLSCGLPGTTPSFGSSLRTPMLVSIFLNSPYTSMSVCSSKACPEAEVGFAKLWFDDPSDSLVTWRVDWGYMRVLRMSSNTWYAIADGCDGSRVALLYRLHNDKHRTSTSFQGYYLMPFFVSAVQ